MNDRIRVATDLHEYRVACAELPVSTCRVEELPGAVVVLRGRGDWPAAVADAATRGAVAVIVADPAPVSRGVSDAGIPVLLTRSLLPDALTRAVRHAPAPRAIEVEAAAAERDIRVTLRDAVGWARTLAAAPVHVRVSASTGSALLAHADAGGIPVTLTLTILEAGDARVRVLALGETTTEVVVDPFAGIESVEVATRDGRTTLPAGYETAERAALRRVQRVMDGVESAADLDDVRADDFVAAAIARG